MLTTCNPFLQGVLERVSGRERVKRPTISSELLETDLSAQPAIYCFGWLAGLGKLLQSIKLFAEHAFYSWRDLLESAVE